MQYHKIIEQSEYDNNGNFVDQTRYEVIGGKRKLYIYGYDYCSGNNRKLEISYSYDMNNYKPILTYFSSKRVGKYIYHCDKTVNQEIYGLIQKMYNLQSEQEDKEKDNSRGCSIA
jgi:hypothetical protein